MQVTKTFKNASISHKMKTLLFIFLGKEHLSNLQPLQLQEEERQTHLGATVRKVVVQTVKVIVPNNNAIINQLAVIYYAILYFMSSSFANEHCIRNFVV